MPIRLDGSTGITVGTAVTVGTSDIRIGNNVDIDATSIVGVSTIGVTTAYVTSINDGSIGLKNRIINPSMEIDQRFAGVTTNFTTSNAYCVDRWAISAGAAVSGTLTAQRVATSAPGGPRYALRMARTSGTFSSYLIALQTIETANCYDLAGRQVTVSFKARGGSSYNGATVNSWVRTGTAADEGNAGATAGTWTGWAQASGSLSANVTTSFQTFSYTVTLGSSVQEIALGIYTGNFTGTGSANDYLDITDVQLEVGPVASTFERRSYSQEFALCARYYESIDGSGSVPLKFGNDGMCISSTVALFQVGGFYPKRVVPVATLSSPGTFAVVNSTAGLIVATNASIINYGAHNASMTLTVASGLTAGNATQLYSVSGQTPKIQLSSEL